MKLREHLTPEQNIIHMILMRIIAVGKQLGEFSTWLLTGVATILGAILININAISKILSAANLRWGITILVASLFCGVIVRQYGVFITAGIALTEELYDELYSSDGKRALQKMTASPDYIKTEISSAFYPPFSRTFIKNFDKGASDPLSGDKTLGKRFSIQIVFFWLQCVFGATGLLVLGLGI